MEIFQQKRNAAESAGRFLLSGLAGEVIVAHDDRVELRVDFIGERQRGVQRFTRTDFAFLYRGGKC